MQEDQPAAPGEEAGEGEGHTRHAAAIKQLEHSLNSRERMYKDRITGLEGQVGAIAIYLYMWCYDNVTPLS